MTLIYNILVIREYFCRFGYLEARINCSPIHISSFYYTLLWRYWTKNLEGICVITLSGKNNDGASKKVFLITPTGQIIFLAIILNPNGLIVRASDSNYWSYQLNGDFVPLWIKKFRVNFTLQENIDFQCEENFGVE